MAPRAVVATTRRTTAAKPARPRTKTSFDLDAEMAEQFGEIDLDKIPVIEIGPLYGEMFHLVQAANLFNMSALGDLEEDSAALQRYMVSMVHPYDQAKFRGVMGRAINLDADRLLLVMKRMTEAVASGKVTTMSAVSTRTSAKGATKTLSEVN